MLVMKLLVLLGCRFAFATSTTEILKPCHEASVVKTSLAGCCGATNLDCSNCIMPYHDYLELGSYKHIGHALLNFRLNPKKQPKLCKLQFQNDFMFVMGRPQVALFVSNNFFLPQNVSWNTKPQPGTFIKTFDIQEVNIIDVTKYCQYTANHLLTFTLIPEGCCSYISFPTAESKYATTLTITYE